MPRTVITYGTFDMLHIGHVLLFERLREMGDRLVVAVSTDEFNKTKGKSSLISFEHRKRIVESIRYVDVVIPETSWEQKVTDIRDYAVDIFAIGEDWRGEFDFLKEYCEVSYLTRTPDVSSTELKHALSCFSSVNREDLVQAFDVIETLKRDLF